jgi:long-chain fatty acid transport protein
MGAFYEFESAPRAGLLGGDASLKYEDKDAGFGGNVGVIYKPLPATTLGLVYNSKVELEFEDRLSLRDFGPLFDALIGRLDGTRIAIDMNVPATATASLQQALTDATTLYANLNWQDWSDFGKVGLEIDNPDQTSATVNRDYKDTWHGALGVRHRVDQGALANWSLSTGIAYDSSAVSPSDLTADFVVGKAWRLGLGARREICPGTTLDLGFTLIWTGDLDIDQQGAGPFNPRLQGSYEDTVVYVFGGSVTFDF